MYRRKEKDMITCGCCGHNGEIDEDFFFEIVDGGPWAVLKCTKCGAELIFDPLCYIDVDNLVANETYWE